MIGKGRRQPYTEAGVKRMPCARCGERATFQWQICSDGNLWRPICVACDVSLNEKVLEFMGDKDVKAKMAKYREELR